MSSDKLSVLTALCRIAEPGEQESVFQKISGQTQVCNQGCPDKITVTKISNKIELNSLTISM